MVRPIVGFGRIVWKGWTRGGWSVRGPVSRTARGLVSRTARGLVSRKARDLVSPLAGDPEVVFAGTEADDDVALTDRFEGDLADGSQGVTAFADQPIVGCRDKHAGSGIGGDDEVHEQGI